MSMENVKGFYEAIAGDEELRLKLTELSQNHRNEEMNAAKADSLLEKEILPLAAQMGWEFSLTDLHRYGEELQKSRAEEDLSEDELAVVSGGFGLCILGGENVAKTCGCAFVGWGTDKSSGGICVLFGEFHQDVK